MFRFRLRVLPLVLLNETEVFFSAESHKLYASTYIKILIFIYEPIQPDINKALLFLIV